jgi:hypothetical protein
MHISRRRTPTPASTGHSVPHSARAQSSGTGGWLRPGWRRAAVLAGGVLALAAAPAALAGSLDAAGGQAVRGGVKNPSRGGYLQTTQIWANNSSWGTRQSNLGSGGSAIYGCRSAAGNLPCLDADNLKGGTAFSFITTGNTGGTILVGNEKAAPFTTNGHGEAKGLNANYLQGKQANEFQLASQPAANANALGGQPASSYVNTGQLLFADIGPGPVIQNTRGATTVGQLETTYTVVFGTTNVSKCAYTASPQGAALTSGQLGVAASATNSSAVVVNAPSGFSGGFDLQVTC